MWRVSRDNCFVLRKPRYDKRQRSPRRPWGQLEGSAQGPRTESWGEGPSGLAMAACGSARCRGPAPVLVLNLGRCARWSQRLMLSSGKLSEGCLQTLLCFCCSLSKLTDCQPKGAFHGPGICLPQTLRCSKCERKHRTLRGTQRNPRTCGPQETAGGRETQAPLTEKPTNQCTRSNRSRNRPPLHASLPAAGRVCRCGRAHTRPSTSPSACRADGCSLPTLWAVPAHVFTSV